MKEKEKNSEDINILISYTLVKLISNVSVNCNGIEYWMVCIEFKLGSKERKSLVEFPDNWLWNDYQLIPRLLGSFTFSLNSNMECKKKKYSSYIKKILFAFTERQLWYFWHF